MLAALAIFLGALITGSLHPVANVLMACVSGACVMAGGNVINDYLDMPIDQINKPGRPLPARMLQPNQALNFSIILFVLGIFLSIFIKVSAVGLTVFTSAGLILYSARLKGMALVGNMAVSFYSALAFVYGGLAVGEWKKSLIPAGFAFLFHLGREIIKDVEDQKADAVNAVKTLPVQFGQTVAIGVVTGVFGLLILFTLVPFIFDIYGKGYFWVVLTGVDLVLVIVLVTLWSKPLPDTLRRIALFLKADMFVGLLAIYIGNLK
ncbi:MAG: geranylgeranylglycerol-phosphate geranylgeranyltransferase [bacterium]